MISIDISRQIYILLQYSNTIHSIQCCCFCSYYMAWNVHLQLGIHIMPPWYILKEAFYQKITKNKMLKLVIFTFKNNCRCYVNYVVSSIASVKKKYDANFQNLITDLKSARKKTDKKLYFKMRTWYSEMTIGKLHCELWFTKLLY